MSAFASQYKEAKRCRANEAFQLLASGVTLATHARQLLSPVTSRLHLAASPTLRAKLQQLLVFAARGLRTNPTAGPKQVLELAVGLMEGCLAREEAARARAKEAAGPAAGAAAGLGPAAAAVAAAARREAGEGERAALHESLVLEFCLHLLSGSLRRGVLAGARRSPPLLRLLDPALPLLVRCLRVRSAACVGLALRCLAALAGLPLPGMAAAALGSGRNVVALLKRLPSVRHPIAQVRPGQGGRAAGRAGWRDGSGLQGALLACSDAAESCAGAHPPHCFGPAGLLQAAGGAAARLPGLHARGAAAALPAALGLRRPGGGGLGRRGGRGRRLAHGLRAAARAAVAPRGGAGALRRHGPRAADHGAHPRAL